MQYNIKSALFIVLSMSLLCSLIACGGGGGGGVGVAPVSPVKATGRFVDGPVVGLGYNSGIASGVTSADSSFTYQVGGSVKFYIGDVVLGTAVGAPTVTPLAFVPGSDATNPQVINIVRFLLSVGDLDQTTGIITVPKSVFDAAKGKSIDFATATDVQLTDLVKAVTQNDAAILADVNTAISHLTQCIDTEFQGRYTGKMTNAPPEWVVQINLLPDGKVTGQILVNGETLDGTLTSGTDFKAVASGGCSFSGTLDPGTGVISGTWTGPAGSNITGGKFSLSRT